jgi:ABC-type antimicrobial peptide transport system permease subunit
MKAHNYENSPRESGGRSTYLQEERAPSAIWSMDPDQAVGTLRTLEEVVDVGLSQPRLRSFLLGLFAVGGLALAAAGLYGLLSLHVAQRQHEIGIRIALGASRRRILTLVLGKGISLTLGGLGLGLVASRGLSRFLSNLVFGVDPEDPLSFVVGAAILVATALAAIVVPAVRATQLDPVMALRSE